MKIFCLKCRKDTENIGPKMVRTKNSRLIMQPKCPVYRIKKSRFVKEQEAKGLLSNLGIKTAFEYKAFKAYGSYSTEYLY